MMRRSSETATVNHRRALHQPLDPAALQPFMLPGTADTALLFGLLNTPRTYEVVARHLYADHNIVVTARVTPDDHAHLYVLSINACPAGSVFLLRVADNLYHMVGFFVDQAYRSSLLDTSLPGYRAGKHANQQTYYSPAELLLKACYQKVLSNKKQMVLEVMNENASAWKLYQKELAGQGDRFDSLQMTLLDADLVPVYAAVRGKNIGEWHFIEHHGQRVERGIRWAHIPHFGGVSRWSINRIYHIKNANQPNVLSQIKFPLLVRLGGAARNARCIVQYGQWLQYLKLRLRRASIRRAGS